MNKGYVIIRNGCSKGSWILDDQILVFIYYSHTCVHCLRFLTFCFSDSFDVSRNISVDTARFKACEGLMKTELFGVDSPTLPRLIEQAIRSCSMDVRREMWQSIYLSGGTSLIPGFPERLQKELGKIAPPSINVQVSLRCT